MSTQHYRSRVVVAWQEIGLRAVTRLLLQFLRTFENCGGLSAQKCGGANPVSMRVAAVPPHFPHFPQCTNTGSPRDQLRTRGRGAEMSTPLTPETERLSLILRARVLDGGVSLAKKCGKCGGNHATPMPMRPAARYGDCGGSVEEVRKVWRRPLYREREKSLMFIRSPPWSVALRRGFGAQKLSPWTALLAPRFAVRGIGSINGATSWKQ